MIQVPITPYWENAAQWWISTGQGNIDQFYQWLENQGVVGLPRAEYTPYLEFMNPYQAVIFRSKWA
jgi:hypothetical protein